MSGNDIDLEDDKDHDLLGEAGPQIVGRALED